MSLSVSPFPLYSRIGSQYLYSVYCIQYLAHQVEHQAFASLLGLENPFNLLDTDWNVESDFYDWLNQHYLKTKNPADIVAPFKAQLSRLNIRTKDETTLSAVIVLQAERVKTLREMAEKSRYFFEDTLVFDEKGDPIW